MKQEFYNLSLLDRNSFHLDEQASKLIEFDEVDDLQEIFAENPPKEWYVLSGGNNVLFTKTYSGVILTPTSQTIEIISEDRASARVRVAAGVEWDDLVEWAVERDLWGIENLSLIPGKAGAAPVQNIGAYGVEVKDVLVSVEMFCPDTNNSLTLAKEYCSFGYRDSIFKSSLRGRVIITHITISLSKVPKPNLGYGDVISEVASRGEVSLRNIRDAICSIRTAKLPSTDEFGNAGSFFKNPIVEAEKADALKAEYPDMPLYAVADDPTKAKLAAGWLIDKAGYKGYTEGRVGVHSRQALVLINLGGATGVDVIALSDKIREAVASKFGVDISPEVNIL